MFWWCILWRNERSPWYHNPTQLHFWHPGTARKVFGAQKPASRRVRLSPKNRGKGSVAESLPRFLERMCVWRRLGTMYFISGMQTINNPSKLRLGVVKTRLGWTVGWDEHQSITIAWFQRIVIFAPKLGKVSHFDQPIVQLDGSTTRNRIRLESYTNIFFNRISCGYLWTMWSVYQRKFRLRNFRYTKDIAQHILLLAPPRAPCISFTDPRID